MPRRGAPSQVREASCFFSTWTQEKFADTRQEHLVALRFRRSRQGQHMGRVLWAGGAWQELGGTKHGRTRETSVAVMLRLRGFVRSLGKGCSCSLSNCPASPTLHRHFTAKVSPSPRCGRQNATGRLKGCGQSTSQWRCRRAKAGDASISRWCCGPRHQNPGCLRVPGS